jgi:hypothetical protein
MLDSKLTLLFGAFVYSLNEIRRLLGYEYGHDVVYADDKKRVEWEDALVIRKTIYRNTVVFDWERGDVVLVDNHRLAHGRNPWFVGSRKVFVSWF